MRNIIVKVHPSKANLKKKNQLAWKIAEIASDKAKIDKDFTVLVNNGPGSFSSIRVALAVAKGIKISKNVELFGFKDEDLPQFNLENIEVLINKKLIEKKLIKPLYLS